VPHSRASWCTCWLSQSAKTGGDARICSRTKRSRLEDSERAIAPPAARFTLTGASFCVGFLLPVRWMRAGMRADLLLATY